MFCMIRVQKAQKCLQKHCQMTRCHQPDMDGYGGIINPIEPRFHVHHILQTDQWQIVGKKVSKLLLTKLMKGRGCHHNQ